jgi:hypothetical protein
MMTVAAPSSLANAALSDDTLVTTVGPINAGLSQIPQGTSGTVIAALGNGTACEVLFGPPVSAAETVTGNLLVVA